MDPDKEKRAALEPVGGRGHLRKTPDKGAPPPAVPPVAPQRRNGATRYGELAFPISCPRRSVSAFRNSTTASRVV